MAEAGIAVVDGKRTKIHYHTGVVTRARSADGAQSRSGARTSNTAKSSSADGGHHELSIVDDLGRERAFELIDMPIAVREGDKVTIVWVVPEDFHAGPHVRVYNHDTGERSAVTPDRIVDWFMRPKRVVLSSTAALVLVSAMLSWLLAAISVLAPYLYFKRRALRAARSLLDGPELAQLEARLSRVPPAQAAAA